MAKKKKRRPPPRDDAELTKRIQEHAPDILKAQVDFDVLVDAVLGKKVDITKSQE